MSIYQATDNSIETKDPSEDSELYDESQPNKIRYGEVRDIGDLVPEIRDFEGTVNAADQPPFLASIVVYSDAKPLHGELNQKQMEEFVKNYKETKLEECEILDQAFKDIKDQKEEVKASDLIEYMNSRKIDKEMGGKDLFLKAKKGFSNSNISQIIRDQIGNDEMIQVQIQQTPGEFVNGRYNNKIMLKCKDEEDTLYLLTFETQINPAQIEQREINQVNIIKERITHNQETSPWAIQTQYTRDGGVMYFVIERCEQDEEASQDEEEQDTQDEQNQSSQEQQEIDQEQVQSQVEQKQETQEEQVSSQHELNESHEEQKESQEEEGTLQEEQQQEDSKESQEQSQEQDTKPKKVKIKLRYQKINLADREPITVQDIKEFEIQLDNQKDQITSIRFLTEFKSPKYVDQDLNDMMKFLEQENLFVVFILNEEYAQMTQVRDLRNPEECLYEIEGDFGPDYSFEPQFHRFSKSNKDAQKGQKYDFVVLYNNYDEIRVLEIHPNAEDQTKISLIQNDQQQIISHFKDILKKYNANFTLEEEN